MGHPNAAQQGTLTSVYNLGCFGGALSTLYTGDRLGRPRTLLLGSSVIALGALVQTACWSRGQMYAGRVIAGLGTGMNTATAGVWQSETSKMRSRGKLVIIQMANCITGKKAPFGCPEYIDTSILLMTNARSLQASVCPTG